MHTLTLTDEQLAVIDSALSQMPYGIVARLVMDINRQLAQQRGTEGAAATATPK